MSAATSGALVRGEGVPGTLKMFENQFKMVEKTQINTCCSKPVALVIANNISITWTNLIRVEGSKFTCLEPYQACQKIRPGLYRAFGVCSAGPTLNPGLRAQAWARSSSSSLIFTNFIGPKPASNYYPLPRCKVCVTV